MLGVAQKLAPSELVIYTPDGKTRTEVLGTEPVTLGRAHTNKLSYPEDAGLSRQHLTIERAGAVWTVRDLGSKNGTQLNGVRLTDSQPLSPGDRIAAGHLVLEFSTGRTPLPDKTVIFEDSQVTPSTFATSLEGALGSQKEIEGARQIRALIRAGTELAGQQSLDELFKTIMDLSIDAVGAARGVLMTLDDSGELRVRATKGQGFRISRTVRDRVLGERTSLLVRDARLDQAFADRMSIVEQQIRSILAVPLQTESRVIGIIYLDSPHFVHEFTKDDLNLLTVMANVAAIRIEHARLGEVEQTERMLAKELEQAAEIQRGLLPKKPPVLKGIDLAGYNAPCRTVGGDYFDFIPYDDGRVALMVADVSGKGMPAAMLMSNLQARVQVLFEDPDDLAGLTMRLNRIIAKNCPANKFISMFLGVYDTKTGDLKYCNAGHNPPLLVRRNGTVQELESTGLVLGIMPNAKYQEASCRLESRDVLVLFSDGVTEATREDSDEQFGEDRLAQTLRENRSVSAQAMSKAVQQRLTEWMGGTPPADDITLIIACRTD